RRVPARVSARCLLRRRPRATVDRAAGLGGSMWLGALVSRSKRASPGEWARADRAGYRARLAHNGIELLAACRDIFRHHSSPAAPISSSTILAGSGTGVAKNACCWPPIVPTPATTPASSIANPLVRVQPDVGSIRLFKSTIPVDEL